MRTLNSFERRFINQFQGGFPLIRHPFSRVAATLEMGEATLIQMVDSLVQQGWLSRFGPLYDASRLGGAQTLAALTAPVERFDEIAEIVNGFDEVAHNYRREHELNMWFVLSVEHRSKIAPVLSAIERSCGVRVYNFPKEKEFYLGLYLELGDDGSVKTVPSPDADRGRGYHLDARDRQLVVATQNGLPLTAEPYALVAEQVGFDEKEVISRLRLMLDSGAIRRVGAIPNHYRLGLKANGMTVWDVADDDVESAGADIARLPFVSHCYQRPRYQGIWAYNLFAMVHDTHRQGVIDKAIQIEEILGSRCQSKEMLVSSACLKKVGLRLAA